MFRKIALVVAAVMLVTPLTPSLSLAWHSPPGPYYYGGYGHYRHYDYHSHYHDDAWLWVGGILLGSLFLAAMLQPPVRETRVYTQQPVQTYSYPPYVPPGLCRWERYIIDPNGRFVLDQYGQPIKEYTIGSCQYPPPY